MDLSASCNIKTVNFKKKINFNSNSSFAINFKGNAIQDSFESTADKEIIEEKRAVLRKIKALEKKKAEFKIAPAVVENCNDKINEYYFYLDKLQNSSDIAFIYNPDLEPREKYETAKDCDYLLSLADFSQQLGVSPLNLSGIVKSGLIKIDEIECKNSSFAKSAYDKKFINLNDSENKDNVEFIRRKIESGTIKTCDEILKIYEIPSMNIISELIANNELKCFGIDNNFGINTSSALIDLDDGEATVILEKCKAEYNKVHPKKSKFKNKKFIPAAYLQKLGFGDVKAFRRLISQGFLKGKVEKIESSEGVKFKTFIDSKTPDFENKLLRLRSLNDDILTLKEISKQTGLSQTKLKKALVDDEMEIIPEYLFDGDCENILFDLKNPKNTDFLNKRLFEQQMIDELSAERKAERIQKLKGRNKDQSLRMSLAWHFCPNTRKTASDIAKTDGKLSVLFEKEANNEELTEIEERTLNSYRKYMWNIAGSKELSDGMKKADKLLKLYFESGLEAIEDEEIKEIFEQYQ